MAGVVLLSGGLDSTVAAARAVQEGGLDLALTMDYGQIPAESEIDAASGIAGRLGVEHRVVSLPFLGSISGAALHGSRPLPEPAISELDDHGRSAAAAAAVWVPNRNGLFINVAACFAESLGADRVVVGFNAEEAETFPDNSKDFLHAAARALAYSTGLGVRVESPTAGFDKTGLVRMGIEIKASLELIWSCYRNGPKHCWKCSSCLRLKRALENNNVFESFEAGDRRIG